MRKAEESRGRRCGARGTETCQCQPALLYAPDEKTERERIRAEQEVENNVTYFINVEVV